MKKSRAFLVAALAAVLGLVAGQASADPFFTQLGQVSGNPNPSVGPDVVYVTGSGGTGFSNFIQTGMVGPIATGNVVAVGAVSVDTAVTTGPNALLSGQFSGGTQTAIAVFTVAGVAQVNTGNGAAVANFTAGNVSVYLVNNGTFAGNNPTTWGTGNAPIASWTLATPANITQGNAQADNTPFAAAQVNIISGTITAQSQLSGPLLFDKALGNLLTATTFDPFGMGQIQTPEQLEVRLFETIRNGLNGGDASLTQAQRDVLNALAAAFGAGLFNSPGFNAGPLSGSGFDFVSTFLFEAVPGVQFRDIPKVPEPGSMLVWGSLMGVVALRGAARRRKAKLAA